MSTHLKPQEFDDLLLGIAASATKAHLNACPQCRRRSDEMRQTLGTFRAAAVGWSEGAAKRVAPPENRWGVSAKMGLWLRPAWVLATAAVLLAVDHPAFDTARAQQKREPEGRRAGADFPRQRVAGAYRIGSGRDHAGAYAAAAGESLSEACDECDPSKTRRCQAGFAGRRSNMPCRRGRCRLRWRPPQGQDGPPPQGPPQRGLRQRGPGRRGPGPEGPGGARWQAGQSLRGTPDAARAAGGTTRISRKA